MPSAAELEAYRLMSAGRFADALPFAQRAIADQAECIPAHGMLATIFLKLGRRDDAEDVVVKALDCRRGSADAVEALAHVSMLLGRHERSNELYRAALELAPGDARFWYNLASSERSLGRLEAAAEACDRAIALDRTRFASYLLRSELRVQTAESNHVAELRAELARPGLPENGRMFLGYALAKELDDLEQYDEAFDWLSTASGIRRRNLSYDVAVDERKMRRIAEVYPVASSRQEPPAQDSGRYLFIIGLPRTGTTLLEHMLLGLDGVRSNAETENFARALFSSALPGPGDEFARAAGADPSAVAARYRDLAGGDETDAKIIEKLPMNYLYAGAIRRALPAARIVEVRRHPIDSCFAMYRTLFGEAYPFSYDLEDLARYYAAYGRLMAHWRGIFGDSILSVDYDDLVGDPREAGARVAAHCGLAWRDEAVEVHKKSFASFTASAAQIRRPIYRSSSGRWRNYERRLEPLARALARLGVDVR